MKVIIKFIIIKFLLLNTHLFLRLIWKIIACRLISYKIYIFSNFEALLLRLWFEFRV